MSIPKVIHYCWFGDDRKKKEIEKYINTWKNVLNDYEIIEWNEKNTDFTNNSFAKSNFEKGKYAFVSDYVRLKVLYEYGGIYLDTDIEVKKKFDDMLNNEIFIGFMFDCNVGTAVIGAEENNKIINELLSIYDDLGETNIPNNDLFTQFLLDNYKDFRLNGQMQLLESGLKIYPKEYFERPTYNSKMGYSVHHYNGSWRDKKSGILKKVIKMVIGDVLAGKLSHYKALKVSPFYQVYLEHKKQGPE